MSVLVPLFLKTGLPAPLGPCHRPSVEAFEALDQHRDKRVTPRYYPFRVPCEYQVDVEATPSSYHSYTDRQSSHLFCPLLNPIHKQPEKTTIQHIFSPSSIESRAAATRVDWLTGWQPTGKNRRFSNPALYHHRFFIRARDLNSR